jgi:excisionase family DNA binding protein
MATSAFSRDELLTATDVAKVLGVQRPTALDYMRRGVIPACKIGRRWYSLRSRLDRHLAMLFDRAPG